MPVAIALNTLGLLLPALFPSWRFFKEVGPGPLVEYRLLKPAETPWKEVMPRPAKLGLGSMLTRLFWNADWNAYLYLISCSERHLAEPTLHSLDELNASIAAWLGSDVEGALQFRILLRTRAVQRPSEPYMSACRSP